MSFVILEKSLSWRFILFKMSFLDVFLGGLLVYGLFRGLWNGFFYELASLLSVIVGIFVALKFSNFVKVILENHVSWSPKTIQIAAFIVTFILVVLGISILAKFFTTMTNFAGLGFLNKIFGGFFGVIKMMLIVSISLNLFVKVNSNNTFIEKKTLDQSLFYHPILKTSAFLYPSLETWFTEIKKEVS